MKDLIYWIMIRACDKFGDRHKFNGACFAGAWKEVTGLKETLDGRAVAAMLHGRDDVNVLYGGSHYERVTAEPEPDAT